MYIISWREREKEREREREREGGREFEELYKTLSIILFLKNTVQIFLYKTIKKTLKKIWIVATSSFIY